MAVPMLFALKPSPPSALEVTTHKGKISLEMIWTKPLSPYMRVDMKTPRLDKRYTWGIGEGGGVGA